MRIGMLTAEIFEADRNRPGITSSHYSINGYLAAKLLDRGHDVVLLSPVASGVDTQSVRLRFGGEGDRSPFEYLGLSFEYLPNTDPSDAGVDVLWIDRLRRQGQHYGWAMSAIAGYRGPIVYNQMITYPGWAPPFAEEDWIAREGRHWLVVNRATDAEAMYRACASKRELPKRSDNVSFATWFPFVQEESLWDNEVPKIRYKEDRDYVQGYIGRFPRNEDRTKRVVHFLNHDRWSRCIWGRTLEWVGDKTGCDVGGPAEQARLPEVMSRFHFTVNCQFDRNPAGCGFWPNRIVEGAMGGVLQLFDGSWGLPEFDDWVVKDQREMFEKFEQAELPTEIERQRQIILPRCDAERNIDEAEERMAEACSL